MASYDRRVRPLHDPTKPLIVYLEFDLNHLKKLVRAFFCNLLQTRGKLECIIRTLIPFPTSNSHPYSKSSIDLFPFPDWKHIPISFSSNPSRNDKEMKSLYFWHHYHHHHVHRYHYVDLNNDFHQAVSPNIYQLHEYKTRPTVHSWRSQNPASNYKKPALARVQRLTSAMFLWLLTWTFYVLTQK